ncbi:MAG: GAF domain-containing protein [Acidobacteriia bacterium]|nr:GAF domain-containing protein [Terriglobia bacterium]
MTAQHCHTISAIADAINPTAKWQDVIRSILRALVENLGYKAALVRQFDDERRTLVAAGSFGLSDTYLAKGAVEIEKSELDREVLAGHVIDVPDMRSDSSFQFHQEAVAEGIGSLLAAPLALRDRIIGVMRVYSAEPRAASEEEKNFLEAAARLTARALISSQRVEALRNISRQITSSVGLQEVLTALLRRTVDELNYKGGIIRLLDATGQKLSLVAATGLSQAYLNKGEIAVARSSVDQAVLRGETVTIFDVAELSRLQYPQEALKEGIRSVHAVPLMVPDRATGSHRVIGVMRVYSAQPRRFSEDETAYIQSIASLGAISLENAQLYDELKRRIDRLQPEEQGWHRVEET